MENITELIRCRRSVRTFDGKEINEDDRKKLALFMEKIENPYEIPVSFKFLDGKKESLPCPVVSGMCHFALAAKEKGINICFNVSDPGIKADADTEYIASYLLPQ